MAAFVFVIVFVQKVLLSYHDLGAGVVALHHIDAWEELGGDFCPVAGCAQLLACEVEDLNWRVGGKDGMDARGYGDDFAWQGFTIGIDGSHGVVAIFNDPCEGLVGEEVGVDLLTVDIDVVAEEFQFACAESGIGHIVEHEHELLLSCHADGKVVGSFRQFGCDESPCGWSEMDGGRCGNE